MSKKEKKEPKHNPEGSKEPKDVDKQNNDIKIEIAGLDKLDEAEQNNIIKLVEDLTTVVNKQSDKIQELESKTKESEKEIIESKKQVLLDRLSQANYDADDFKDMEYASLEIMVNALAKKDGKIKIPKKKDDDSDVQPEIGKHNVLVFNTRTRKFEQFFENKYNQTSDD